MRILPPPWEGTHPAFPKEPEQFQDPLALFDWLQFASAGGLLGGTALRIFRPAGYAYTPAIAGGLAIAATGFFAFVKGLGTIVDKHEVYSLLEAEKIPIPKQKIFESTSTWSGDDSTLLGAAIGAVTFAVMRRPLPGAGSKILRALGASCFGATAALVVHNQYSPSPSFEEYQVWLLQQELAKRIYESKMGTEAPHWLYPLAAAKEELEDEQDKTATGLTIAQLRHGGGGTSMERKSLGPHTDLLAVLSDRGFEPPSRNYLWRYSSADEGLRLLEENLALLQRRRGELVELAEFLWYDVARAERGYHNLRASDTETSRLLRKKLEFLSSYHGGTWGQISAIDWVIADTKKIILQIQKGGDWMPQKPQNVDLKTYRPVEILENLRRHRDRVVIHLADVEKRASVLDEPSDLQEKLKRTLREIRENVLATEALIDEMEQRVRDPGSVSDVD